jgi:hypothetical protein
MGFLAIGICVSGYIMYTGVQEATIPPVRNHFVHPEQH